MVDLNGMTADDADVALVYHAQTTAENRGDFEDNLGDSADSRRKLTQVFKKISEFLKLTWNSKVNQSLQRHVS